MKRFKWGCLVLQASVLPVLILSSPVQSLAASTTSFKTITVVITTVSNPLVTLARNYEHNKKAEKDFQDCSMFVQSLVKKTYGINLPRTSRDQAKVGLTVSKKKLVPGDLLFFNTNGKYISFVGIYEGQNSFIGLTSKGIMSSSLHLPYWSKRFVKAKRLVAATPKEALSLFFKNIPRNQDLAQLQLDPALSPAFTAHRFAKGTRTLNLLKIKKTSGTPLQEEYLVQFKAALESNADPSISDGPNQLFMTTERKNGRYIITRIETAPVFTFVTTVINI